jgi:hypothetical protein
MLHSSLTGIPDSRPLAMFADPMISFIQHLDLSSAQSYFIRHFALITPFDLFPYSFLDFWSFSLFVISAVVIQTVQSFYELSFDFLVDDLFDLLHHILDPLVLCVHIQEKSSSFFLLDNNFCLLPLRLSPWSMTVLHIDFVSLLLQGIYNYHGFQCPSCSKGSSDS